MQQVETLKYKITNYNLSLVKINMYKNLHLTPFKCHVTED